MKNLKRIFHFSAEKNALLKKERNISFEEITSVSERLQQINTLLEEKEMRWLELSEFAS